MKNPKWILGTLFLAYGIAAAIITTIAVVKANPIVRLTPDLFIGAATILIWFVFSSANKIGLVFNLNKTNLNAFAVFSFIVLQSQSIWIHPQLEPVHVNVTVFVLTLIWIYGWPVFDFFDLIQHDNSKKAREP